MASESSGPSNDMKAFREVLAKAKNIVVLSGASISAESGVPTFRYSVYKIIVSALQHEWQ